MVRRVFWVVAVLPCIVRAQSAPGAAGDSATIAALEKRVETAVAKRDAAFLDSVYAPSFRFKHSTGTIESRAGRLTAMRRPLAANAPGRTLSRTVDSIDVEVHGNLALVTGRIHVVRDGGDPRWQNYTIRYARVYARATEQGPWLLLTHHSTGDAQGPPTTPTR
jgi:ketosteroid isomerase-like protein